MTREAFEQLVDDALDELPDEFQQYLNEVIILVAPEPDEEQRRLARIPKYYRMFGLFQGVPKTIPGAGNKFTPNRITIFQNPIEEAYDSDEEIKDQIKSTVFHELGHYFGMTEEQLRQYKKFR
jgi:predicted Zn-dependent protease with MMP-like domain